MSGPRKPARPGSNAPRGKVRVAGSGPSTGNVAGQSPETGDAKPVSLEKASSPANAAPQVAGRAPSAPTPESGFLTWRKVAVVAGIALVVGVFAIVAAFKPGVSSDSGSNLAFTNASDTSALKAQAGDRICAVLSVDPTKFDDWANNAKTGLTGEALTQFNEYQSTTRDLAAQSGQGAECQVDMVAISDMDESNATVITTMIISSTQQGVAILGGPGQARTELGLQKIDGQWLISRISDF